MDPGNSRPASAIKKPISKKEEKKRKKQIIDRMATIYWRLLKSFSAICCWSKAGYSKYLPS